MQIRVQDVSATCRVCGGIEFHPVIESAVGLSDWLYCAECLAQRVHADLLVQIGEEVLKQTSEFISTHQAIAAGAKRPYAN